MTADIQRPRAERPPVQPLSAETVGALADTIATRYRALIVLGAGAGLRVSEALGLTQDRINWLGRSVTIDRQLLATTGEDRSPVFGPVKDAHNRPRTIPVSPMVLDALSVYIERFGLGQRVWCSLPRPVGR